MLTRHFSPAVPESRLAAAPVPTGMWLQMQQAGTPWWLYVPAAAVEGQRTVAHRLCVVQHHQAQVLLGLAGCRACWLLVLLMLGLLSLRSLCLLLFSRYWGPYNEDDVVGQWVSWAAAVVLGQPADL